MRLAIFFFCTLFLSSCFIEQHKEDLIGEWQLAKWTVAPNGEELKGYKMDFTFGADNRYSVDYGSEKEIGNWRVSGNNLYTRQDEMMEKMVKIIYIQNDTLRFEMNRSGRMEEVTLVKVK